VDSTGPASPGEVSNLDCRKIIASDRDTWATVLSLDLPGAVLLG